MKATRVLVLLGCLCSAGCEVVNVLTPEGKPPDEQICQGYDRIKLNTSSSADVLTVLYMPEYELLSQSKSVIASAGQKTKGRKLWCKMVAFDENSMTARRKYLLIVDDRLNIMEEPKKFLRFDCEMILEPKILEEPYANENARRIAILRQVLENTRKDIDEVGPDNKTINTCGMLSNQALETVLVKLDSSPATASKLSDSAGLEFDHISYNKGKIRMAVEDNTVVIKLRLGSAANKFEQTDQKSG
jgi:hypothetical protein